MVGAKKWPFRLCLERSYSKALVFFFGQNLLSYTSSCNGASLQGAWTSAYCSSELFRGCAFLDVT